MKVRRIGVLSVFAWLAACSTTPPEEELPEDQLVRVASRAEGGVFRDIRADFTGYKRLMIEPLTVSFKAGWRRRHPTITDAEIHRIVVQAAEIFHEQFVRAMVENGPYTLADVREADVLVIEPRLLDLDIPAPEAAEPMSRTLVLRSVSMHMTGELRDGVTGTLLMRVMMFDGEQDEGNGLTSRWAYRVTNAHEILGSLAKWSQLVREALNVAKAARPAQDLGQ
jgi:hypothetical protein